MNMENQEYYTSPVGEKEFLKTFWIFLRNIPYVFLIGIGYGITLTITSKIFKWAIGEKMEFSDIGWIIMLIFAFVFIISIFSAIIGTKLHNELVKQKIFNKLSIGVYCTFYSLLLDFIYTVIFFTIPQLGEYEFTLNLRELYSFIFSFPVLVIIGLIRVFISTVSMYGVSRTSYETFCNKCNYWIEKHHTEIDLNPLEEEELEELITSIKNKDFSKLLSLSKSEDEKKYMKVTLVTCGKCFSDYYLNLKTIENIKKEKVSVKLDRLIICEEDYNTIKNHILLEIHETSSPHEELSTFV